MNIAPCQTHGQVNISDNGITFEVWCPMCSVKHVLSVDRRKFKDQATTESAIAKMIADWNKAQGHTPDGAKILDKRCTAPDCATRLVLRDGKEVCESCTPPVYAVPMSPFEKSIVDKSLFLPLTRTKSKTLPVAILFVGAEGQGKTTLARDTDARLRAQGVDLQEMIHEVARDVLNRMNTDLATLRTSDVATDQYQEQVFVRQFEEEYSRGFKNYVSDRGPDNLAYLSEHGSALARVMATHKDKLDRYRDHVRQSVIFHVTPSLKCVSDGTRVVSTMEEIHRIDSVIKYILASWDVRPYRVMSPNHAERMMLIGNVIRDRTGIVI